MASLFEEFRLKDVVLKNRIGVSPMCQYSSDNGFPNDWHLVHLGSRAVGGAALVMVEATAVSPEGRISPADSGIYLDEHVGPFARISRFLKQQGAVPGIRRFWNNCVHERGGSSPKGLPRVAPANGGQFTICLICAIMTYLNCVQKFFKSTASPLKSSSGISTSNSR